MVRKRGWRVGLIKTKFMWSHVRNSTDFKTNQNIKNKKKHKGVWTEVFHIMEQYCSQKTWVVKWQFWCQACINFLSDMSETGSRAFEIKQNIVIALGCSPQLDNKALSLNILDTETSVLYWPGNSPHWRTLKVLSSDMEAAAGEKTSMVLRNML